MGKAKTSKPKVFDLKPTTVKLKKKLERPENQDRTPDPSVTTPAFDILTLEEAASLLRVSADGLRADAANGTVPALRVGGEWRFSRPVLWGWVNSPMRVNGTRQKLADLPIPEETEEEYEAYMEIIRKNRDEVDRATKSGKYAKDE